MPQLLLPPPSAKDSSVNPLWVAAGAFLLFGIIKRPLLGFAAVAIGGVFTYRTVKTQANLSEYEATSSFQLNTSQEQAYTLWRNFEQFPRFMSHLKSVRALDSKRSEWVALGPLDKEVSWLAEITDDAENERIAWQSLPGGDIKTGGSVTFKPHPQGRGTIVQATVKYSLPFGPASKALLTLLGKKPEFVLREDLRRFKALAEAGEAPTTRGQSHGPRGLSGKVSEALFRETSNRPEQQAASLVEEAQLQTA